MAQFLDIVPFLGSGVIFFALLQRSVFAKSHENGPAFGRVDLWVALFVSAMFAWLAVGLFTSAPEKPFTEKNILESLVVQVFFGSAVLGYLGWRRLSFRQFFGIGDRSFWKLLLTGMGLMVILFPFIGWIGNLVGTDPSQEQEAVKFFRGTSSLQARLLLAFMAVVVAPIVEEMVFRGLLYRIFRGYVGRVAAMFMMSFLFASIHGNLPTLLPLTLLAFALTAGLEWRGSLVVNIAMHATFNGISLLFMLMGTPS